MLPVDAVDRLLRRQAKLFENAHKVPIELKGLGIRLKQQGIDRTKLYCNPSYLLLPLRDCPHLSQLSREQMAVLTATYFASAYAEIATSETLALEYNLVVSERVFPVYSDPYMILFQETGEEFDHITAFRNICQGLLGRGDVIGFDHFAHLRTGRQVLQLLEDRLCKNGFGGLYLLLRYLLNLALKQLEGFMGASLDENCADPLSVQITAGHATDEARHLTTSLELGLGLLARATTESRETVTRKIRSTLYSMIDTRFSRDPSKVWHYRSSLAVLERALQHPAFAEFPLSASELEALWKKQGIDIPLHPEFECSRRWLAQQIRGLAERLEVRLVPNGEAFEHYRGFASDGAAMAG